MGNAAHRMQAGYQNEERPRSPANQSAAGGAAKTAGAGAKTAYRL